MKYQLFLLTTLAVCNFSIAGEGSGKVSQITAHSDGGSGQGVIMFKTEFNTNKAECSTAFDGSHWTFSLEHESGKAMYSLLLTAYAQDKNIRVVGGDNCSIWGDRETARYISIDD